MRKSNSNMLIIALLLITLLCLYFVTNTYSKYTSTSTGEATITVAQWAIKLNSTDVSSGKTFEANKLLSLTAESNNNVASGTIAPSSTVQGTINLDPTGTQVALKYTITLGTPSYSGTATDPNITISGVKIGNGDLQTLDSNNSYSGTIELPGSNGSKTAMTSSEAITITVIATWESTDDSADTAVGVEAGTITVPVTVTVEQVI